LLASLSPDSAELAGTQALLQRIIASAPGDAVA
jgi:hypothetical protein